MQTHVDDRAELVNDSLRHWKPGLVGVIGIVLLLLLQCNDKRRNKKSVENTVLKFIALVCSKKNRCGDTSSGATINRAAVTR